jgi:hypothetical protein
MLILSAAVADAGDDGVRVVGGDSVLVVVEMKEDVVEEVLVSSSLLLLLLLSVEGTMCEALEVED